MLHGELYEKVFKTLFPQYDVIFSYDEESYNKCWTLESVPSFIKRLTK